MDEKPELRKVTCKKCGNTFWTRQNKDKFGFISCTCGAKFKEASNEKTSD